MFWPKIYTRAVMQNGSKAVHQMIIHLGLQELIDRSEFLSLPKTEKSILDIFGKEATIVPNLHTYPVFI